MNPDRRETNTYKRIAVGGAAVVCLLVSAGTAYREGLFTRDTGRYATRKDRTISLHPSDVSFQIPQDWLAWDAEFHNNLHLSHRELQSVRFATGEWDSEYSQIANSALPFEHCAAHVGGEGWGRQGVSFGDLQLRVYITDLSAQEILRGISGPALETAKRLSLGEFNGPGEVQSEIGSVGPWRKAVIRYSVFYGDYGGTGNVEFYVRPVSKYQLVMVFMGNVATEREQILDSVKIANSPPSNSPEPNTSYKR